MNSKLENSPIFILGMHRSGTSLFQCLLDGHPELVVDVSDSRFFTRFVPLAKNAVREERMRLAEDILLRHYHKPEENNYRYVSHIPWEAVRDNFRARMQNTAGRLPDYLASAVLAGGECGGHLTERSRYWVEKTPHHELHTEQIFKWWPEARCIHIVRDPRASYAALHTRRPKEYGVDSVAYMWERSARLLREHQQKWGEDRYLGLRYDDLILNIEREMARVTDFLKISLEPSLFAPTKSCGLHPWGGNSAHGAKFNGVDASSIDKWKQSVSAREIAVLENMIGVEMRQHAFEPVETASVASSLRSITPRARNLYRAVRDRARQAPLLGDDA